MVRLSCGHILDFSLKNLRTSEETRLKIAQGVRRGWSLRRKKLMVQDGCFVEWRDIIADAARNGFAGGVALQWNSYKILTEKLQQDWLENLQKRRSMPRPRGNRRAPKTPEQRKKISEAIAAKWLDQGYRERVCSGITNYHGTPGTKTPRKSKPPKEPTVKRGHVKNKLIQTRSATIEAKVQTTAIAKRKKSGTPYKDPMAGEKLEMITKIRAQRAALETEKKEAIKRARALIAEAEKAADALEAVATRSSFVQASLVETRKLVAEARKSLRCAVDDKPPTQNASDDTSADSARFELDSYNLENQNNVMVPENKPVNGIQLPLSTVNGNYHFDVSDTFNEMKQFRVPHSIESSMERAYLLPSPSTALENVNKGLNVTNFHVSQSMANEAVRYDQTAEERTENDPSGTLENKVSSPMTKPKMRWMRGRLVEAGEE